jgi:hypothetical protein
MFIGHGQLSPNFVSVFKNGIATAHDVIFGFDFVRAPRNDVNHTRYVIARSLIKSPYFLKCFWRRGNLINKNRNHIPNVIVK